MASGLTWREPTRSEAALLGVGALVLLGLALVVGVWTKGGQVVDGWLGSIIHDTIPGADRRALATLARSVIPYALVPPAVLLWLIALVRRRWGPAAVAALLPGTIPLTWWLREDVVTRPDLGVAGYAYNTFPSTHATAGFVLIAALVLLWPARFRTWSATTVAVLAIVVGAGNVAWHAHRVVDVSGSLLLVAAPALLAYAALCAPATRPSRSGQ